MALKRVFAGFYTRYDGKPIFVVRVLKDIDTGESIVVCKDASFSKEDNEHYYLIRYTSFCEQVEVDGMLRDKYVRQTRREIDEGTVREVYENGFPEPKSKPFTYVDDEYAERAIRCSRTYYEYAKDICENYRMDLRRYKLIRERKQYIGVSNREAYQAMCEDLAFAQQSLKTVLNDYADLFRKRFSEGLSIRKAADAMQQNRGLTRSLAAELATTHIRVNCIAPGVIKTDMLDALPPEVLPQLAEETPLRRLGTPEDIAHAAAFLASEKADFITGQVLTVDGGFIL